MDKIISPKTKRDAAGRFQKGCSGNYGGRPKVDPRLRGLARGNIEGAVIALTELSINSKANDRARSLAGIAILEAGLRTNLFCRYMKGAGMSVGRYLLLRPSGAGKKKDTQNPKPPSELVQKLKALRPPGLVESVERVEQDMVAAYRAAGRLAEADEMEARLAEWSRDKPGDDPLFK